ncbi:hypothetical protein LTR53_007383 [Teratosphaeriaceae sp. CCFEE 6253]|nr:hypothetical protein LTR53_007383 [Teratosphaeriaceae sp. CCFEE 6253]
MQDLCAVLRSSIRLQLCAFLIIDLASVLMQERNQTTLATATVAHQTDNPEIQALGSLAITTSIQSLPTDVMKSVNKHLCLSDVQTFRQTCKWAKKQAFRQFAVLKYRKVVVQGSFDGPVRRLTAVMKRGPQLASSVEILDLRLSRLRNDTYWYRDWNEAAGRASTTASLMSLLPHVEQLLLTGLNSDIFAIHLHPLTGATPCEILWPKLVSLELTACMLSIGDWRSLMELAGTGLRKLQLCDAAVDTSWHDVMAIWRSDLGQLECLVLNHLSVCRPGELLVGVLFHPRRKVMGSYKKMEIVDIRETWLATMHGAQAVKVGLEMILESLA